MLLFISVWESKMKRVLLVEDKMWNGVLFDYFECIGMEPDYADNGELGLVTAMDNPFDIIILIWMLPRMDGLTACNKLRDQGNTTRSLCHCIG